MLPLFEPNADDGGIELDEDDVKPEDVKEENGVAPSDDQLSLETLDIDAIRSQGKTLMGSAGKQYDYNIAKLDPAERLAYQKRSLNARLGLGGEYTEEDLIDESDVHVPEKPILSRLNTLVDRSNGSDSPVEQTPGGDQSLSKRQLNMLKRKNKKELKGQASKVRIVDLRRPSLQSAEEPPPQPLPTPVKLEKQEPNGNGNDHANDPFSLERTGGDDTSRVISEFKGAAIPIKSELQQDVEEEGVEWPFERLCDYLMVDMFDPNWEIRHGAAMGLRDIMRVHGTGAGRERGKVSITK